MGGSSGEETSFLRIPGNIKQSLVPFNLNPGDTINNAAASSDKLNGATPQIFSFRQQSLKNSKSKYGLLNICPNSFFDFINDDVSYQLLFNRDPETGEIKKDSINGVSILNSIPGIQIREFLPDNVLNQIMDFLSKCKSVITTEETAKKKKIDRQGSKNVEQNKKAKQEQKKKDLEQLGANIYKAMVWLIQYLTCVLKENLITDIGSSLPHCDEWLSKADEKHKNYVLNFPYMLYYTFLSSVTTNIYELPCMVSGNLMYASDGSAGWGAGKIDLPLDVGGVKEKILKTLLGNIRINYLGLWDAGEGHATMGDTLTITVDLYNDTAVAAINNFVFINTLIPNNRWVQYNVFQHSSSLYDIKIEGYNRLFACTGKFKVTYKGILRDPPKVLLKVLDLKFKSSGASFTVDDIIKHKLIKIPDIYTLEMSFQSCIPENFNTWLFQYASNKNHIHSEYKSNAYKEGSATSVLKDTIQKVGDRFKTYWNDGNPNFPTK